jgi:hypothetical protein
MIRFLLLSMLVAATGCQTTLRQVRELPPSVVLVGPTVGIDVTGPFREAAVEQLEFGLAGAEAEFTRLSQANPEDAAAWYDLGFIRELQGNEELALDAYRRAVGLRDEGVVVTSDN